ncbi:hypothetical protein [Nocardioides flavus (ex Wang et al. 2016)]|uniref:hypothetical protein n=1 Tax=Nocardioides flavus (ex Wang et al. 2016) TaxID=2058780 RepID=UPI00174BF7C2|nr:hypothetical protein [Nocardioides flavus (ex Wang et al. 2016)]
MKPLLPDDDWAFRGRAVYRTPVRHVAVGLLAEGSGWSTGVYVHRLRLPLFVPGEDWTLDWSDRLGGGAHTWSTDDGAELSATVARALCEIGDEQDALRHIADPVEKVNWRMLEDVAGSRVLLGQGGRALRTIEDALAEPRGRSWDSDLVDRLEELQQLLREDGLAGAERVLEARAGRTAGALGISRPSSPR